jgi:polyhydroxybutyrate depolymerase
MACRFNSLSLRFVFTVLICALTAEHSFCQDSKPADGPADSSVKKLGAGDHRRSVIVDEQMRFAIVHVPPSYDSEKPIPVVLALHGAAMNGDMMVDFTGLNETADAKGFVVVYPDGTGLGPLFTWNAGGFVEGFGSRRDDVAFIRTLIEDLEKVVNVDVHRIFATGMSNGGMMCYRLAAEMSDRIAAIAPVAGTMAKEDVTPKQHVSVIHFHGTQDTLVPFDVDRKKLTLLRLKSVEDSIQTWARLDGIEGPPQPAAVISKPGEEMTVTRLEYGPGADGAEVILITIEGGGHTWPGQVPPVKFLGKSAMNISANELMWSFFEKHARKPQPPNQ